MRGDGIRYQGAVVRGQQLLLIKYQPHSGDGFWLFPGGSREKETPEECVARELHEETGLHVEVGRILLEEPGRDDGLYYLWRTYLCTAEDGDPQPGVEPEAEHQGFISEVGWFDLADVTSWNPELQGDSITSPQVLKLRAILGFA